MVGKISSLKNRNQRALSIIQKLLNAKINFGTTNITTRQVNLVTDLAY